MKKKMSLGEAFQKVYSKEPKLIIKSDKVGKQKIAKEQEECLKRGYSVCQKHDKDM